MIPESPWRFGERYLVTDFIQVNNVAIKEKAEYLNQGELSFVESVALWIRDSFYYPLDNAGNPSAQGQFLRHYKGLGSGYHSRKCVYYAWSLPNEVLGFTSCGICIDTANLAVSVLRAKGVDAWVTLGDVKNIKDSTLVGRHAWVEVPWENRIYVLETTIHENGTKNMVEATQVYDRTSDWAKNAGIYFVVQSRYNEDEYKGEGPLAGEIVELLGLPTHRVLLMGKTKTLACRDSRLAKEWRAEERIITKLLSEAYRNL